MQDRGTEQVTSGIRNLSTPRHRAPVPYRVSMTWIQAECELIIPCRDEAAALPALLAKVPTGIAVIVVDNGSRDGTGQVAEGLGARVVTESQPGYGAAVQAGMLAATSEYVAVLDGDGSMDPADLLPMLAQVQAGEADIAVGRRRPVAKGVWPWHARAGNRLVLWWLRRRLGIPLHDIAPMRVCRRQALLDLDLSDRRFGYPVELLQRAAEAGWRFSEHPIDYHPRAAGTRSKVSGSMRRYGAHRSGLRQGAPMTAATPSPVALVVAKAPHAGEVKTRLGAELGMQRAAELASAALLDTLVACVSAFGSERCHLALAGDLAGSVGERELQDALVGWQVFAQVGDGFAARLRHAHEYVGSRTGAPVVQIGMDTPQVTPTLLLEAAAELRSPEGVVLGPAEDGGWWLLGQSDPSLLKSLEEVPMSQPDTCVRTREAVEQFGARVSEIKMLRDVDEVADAAAIAEIAPHTRFAEVWRWTS